MALYEEEDVELFGDNQEDLENSEMNNEQEEENQPKDDDEKQFNIDDDTVSQQKKNMLKKIGIGVGVGAAALIIIPTVVRSVSPKKPVQQQTNQQSVASDNSGANQAFNLDGKAASADPNQPINADGVSVNTTNPNGQNCTNPSDPNCAVVQNNPQVQPVQQTPVQENGQIQQAPTQTAQENSRSNSSNNNSQRESYNNGGSNNSGHVQKVRQPKREKDMPQPPAEYQAKEIQKPNTSYATVSATGKGNKNSNGGTNSNAANSTNGVEGQSQQQADKINGSQNRIRPTNITKKADGINTFLLSTGTYIPLTISTSLNSDNPSYFMGVVSQNVYSKDGKMKLLIPRGSRIIGNYKALSNNTATRMFMFVEKIILPTEEIIALSNENIVDLNGEIGTKGRLNNKFWQRLGNTVLALSFSALDYYMDYRQIKTARDVANSGNAGNISSSTWDNLFSGGSQNVKDIMDAVGGSWGKPKNRIKVKPGTRLNLLVMNDLVLPEYKGR